MRRSEEPCLVFVSNHSSQVKIRIQNLKRFTRDILNFLGDRKTSLSLIFVSDATMRRINRQYLKHDWATDVLAFPLAQAGATKRASFGHFLGEVIISPKRAQVYARQHNLPVAQELARYVCHGILHLKGYSDHSKRKRTMMERKETQLLYRFRQDVKQLL
ncbi:MAG: rRNA maturation RNase YbeY [Candidatus Omnitrophica bacterium]|nr:rRNA maturation RNase YbeY [Candidatus Omnitrophota bacterium]